MLWRNLHLIKRIIKPTEEILDSSFILRFIIGEGKDISDKSSNPFGCIGFIGSSRGLVSVKGSDFTVVSSNKEWEAFGKK